MMLTFMPYQFHLDSPTPLLDTSSLSNSRSLNNTIIPRIAGQSGVSSSPARNRPIHHSRPSNNTHSRRSSLTTLTPVSLRQRIRTQALSSPRLPGLGEPRLRYCFISSRYK
ncbi:uncharacterized protein IL334_005620 [Kwoniella shivajii]|uniref:Uncharacterized protein n=1 Tax=Kwoniella shivajii TaxID=564305 RepID=A0ABZ1D472_9TREE|nr:hypothetical protein IL334_005620 [Kwoniella shivajii]